MARLMMVCMAALIAGSAAAKEPAFERWTPITEHVQPDVIANFAPMSVEQANQLLETYKASLLYEASSGFDQMPPSGVVMRSRRRLTGREGFEIVPDEQGNWVLWQNGVRKNDRLRLSQADNPPLRIMGVPSDVSRVAWRQLSPFNPVVVQFADETFVIQYVSIQIRDVSDQQNGSFWAYVAFGMKFRRDQILEGDLADWRSVLTMGGRRGNEPRLMYLPVDVAGALDTTRDGLMLRFAGVAGGESWLTGSQSALVASAVRLHLGSEESLAERLDSMPSMPRERYTEPGSVTDPLMLAPRTARDPLGAGVETRQLAFADVTVLDLSGLHTGGSSMVGQWDGVDVSGWFGRGMAGVTVRRDLIGGRAMLRMGRMRDTNYTAVGLELGWHPLPESFGELMPVAINGVMQTYRLMGREMFGQQVEIGNRLRLGSTGLEYESSGGLRIYAKNGLVVTPSGVVGARWSFREQRAFLTLGVALEASWNRNWFGKRSAPVVGTPAEGSSPEAAPPAVVQ
ncbi:MAG: hypothetical protein ACI9MC_001442 [Kiritimatiellia bacterium]|jgi:hypothetical protein